MNVFAGGDGADGFVEFRFTVRQHVFTVDGAKDASHLIDIEVEMLELGVETRAGNHRETVRYADPVDV